ncbi:histone-lysine N-methyltransferase, H3 lysine-9 specific SUVH3-like [Iris pallida]|uniref:Histone-lysine N-methyltransferase, H3 lysine-9 specific SUVH3-like n=1 Tax=Iris pallida TaxID=29817 RepID=A0AAX6EXP1_IRIPA|nr:histone-lysine N-methyltransferase, H3 lysine-9 specific SUVH3-like [Iris pallida]
MDSELLDVQPLRTLAPMFPSSSVVETFSVPGGGPFIYVRPSGPNFLSPTLPPPFPSFPTTPQQAPSIDNHDEPVAMSGHTSASGRQVKGRMRVSGRKIGTSGTETSSAGSSKVKQSRKQLQQRTRTHGIGPALVPSCQDPRESAEIVLMAFDALRRWLLQQEEAKEGKDGNRRPDLKAGNVLMTNGLRANMGKRMGPAPGVEIGDIFYFRIELCLVGLHAPTMGGIDYMTSRFGDGDDTVAVIVVSAGVYENEEGDADVLIYSGQGGNSYVDQKLEKGNLALERSLHRGVYVRVVRSAKDCSCPTGKIYIYDGLYKVEESWVVKGKTGYNVFKYKLLRKPEQPDGIATWKKIQKWKDNPGARGRIILPDLSSGIENLPVFLVNEVDDEKGPSHFEYVTKVKYPRPLSSHKPLEYCRCPTACLPGDADCACVHANGGNLPYSSGGILVSRKPLIYECGASCSCSTNCRNRLTQKGTTIRFEVFKTTNKGWGLRSLDPIRAGTFICEYTGEVVEEVGLGNDDAEEDDYIFQAAGADDKALKWNYGPELLGEPSVDNSSESFGSLAQRISAKKMGNVSRFMNHGCSPNVLWQRVLHDHSDEGYPHVMFFAIKHIPPMTELTYDYGLSGGDKSHMEKQCLCGSPKCRGRFG